VKVKVDVENYFIIYVKLFKVAH